MLRRALHLFALVLLAAPLSAEDQPDRPNFVIVLADDLGYGDLACYGHPTIQTPHLDQFASEGLRLTSCYAAHPNCSPSRTGLMTGRNPFRVGVHDWIPMDSPMHVRKREITIATLLRQAGYDTCHVGKWHMNGMFNKPGQPQPPDHGFNYWFSTQNNALPNHRHPDNFVRNGKPVGKLEGYAAPLVAEEAVHWLSDVRDNEKPFFLYVCFHEPHEPIATDPQYAELYPSDDPSLSAHHGNITQMDAAFGKIMTALDEMQIRENTFVLFTSDNGPAITGRHPHGSAGPLRAKKSFMYEGGIRVPGILRWPGHTEPGSKSDEPVCGVDLLPTLCAITDVPEPEDRAIDGTSFLPVLNDRPIKRETPLYWQFNRAKSTPKVAMRVGDWKILATLQGLPEKPSVDIKPGDMESIKTAELDTFELYNLREDIGETNDLSKEQPERLKTMVATLRPLYREVRDETPTWPEWTWPRYESRRIEWPEYSTRGQTDGPQWEFVSVEERAESPRRDRPNRRRGAPDTPPTHRDVEYGPHNRNVMDVWLAESEKPAPVLVSIHGGGFRSGNKRVDPGLLKGCLKSGISVVAITYRLSDEAIAPAQFHDAARAIQFIRNHAEEWNIDPKRIAATGSSAGAGLSLWLAFHDDLADPDSDDPVLRESTRLTCASVCEGQISYDPRYLRELFPENDTYKHPALAQLYDVDLDKLDDLPPEKYQLFEETAPITHLTKDDPPAMLTYSREMDAPVDSQGAGIHHPRFGKVLKEDMDELGIECQVETGMRRGSPEWTKAVMGFIKKEFDRP